MSAYNKRPIRTGPTSVIVSTDEQVTNASGHPGFGRDTKSELFLLAVANMGSATFYETAKARDSRFAKLAGEVAVTDVDWFGWFLTWLRNDANMRTAALVAAGHGVHDRLQRGLVGDNRGLIQLPLIRADEPGEMLAFWTATYGRQVPKPVKRGIADAVGRLYNEYSTLKYDTESHGVRFGDVLALTHPQGMNTHLAKWIMDRRYGRMELINQTHLPMVTANARLRSQVTIFNDLTSLLNTDLLKQAGMTWEDVLSLAGPRLDKKAMWTALIPTMGYMALLRNLRNFDEAGVDDTTAGKVIAKLGNPDEVAKSRQLPMRFLSAHRAAPSLRWSYTLELALQASLVNIPTLSGRTLIMVDTSGSMRDRLSAKSELLRWDAAVIFGLAMAARCEGARVVSFSGPGDTKVFTPRPAESLLTQIKRWESDRYFFGGGTYTGGAIRQHFQGHDRVIVLTDEQDNSSSYNYGYHPNWFSVNDSLPQTTPLYTWNLAGYATGHAPSGSRYRHTFGGLTDQGFGMVPLLEGVHAGRWPWEMGERVGD